MIPSVHWANLRCFESEVGNHWGKTNLSSWRVECSKLSWSTVKPTNPAFSFKTSKSSVTVNLGVELFDGAMLSVEGDLAVAVDGGEWVLKWIGEWDRGIGEEWAAIFGLPCKGYGPHHYTVIISVHIYLNVNWHVLFWADLSNQSEEILFNCANCKLKTMCININYEGWSVCLRFQQRLRVYRQFSP